MKKLELTKDELEKLYHLPPKDVEKETEFQITYRMGRNSLVLELIKKINEELTPYVEYHDNGNVYVKGQKNSGGQEEGIWEWFFENGNIRLRTPFKEGKEDGIEEFFYKNGNITKTRLWKDGKLIEETKPKLTLYIEYYDNGNVRIKGQKNSKGQRGGIWEWFYRNGNILWRTSYKDGKKDGIEEFFYENGNISMRTPYKEGWIDGIQTFYDEQGNITETRLWKDGKLIEETKPKPQPDPQLIDSMVMRYTHDFL
jgi:antitoxin component YwqK of YwqJK toxin-antitoxin module